VGEEGAVKLPSRIDLWRFQ